MGSVHGSCVEMKGAAIFSFPGAEGQTLSRAGWIAWGNFGAFFVSAVEQVAVAAAGLSLLCLPSRSQAGGLLARWPRHPLPEGLVQSLALGSSCCAAHLPGASCFSVLVCVPQAGSRWGAVVLRCRSVGSVPPWLPRSVTARPPPAAGSLRAANRSWGGQPGAAALGIKSWPFPNESVPQRLAWGSRSQSHSAESPGCCRQSESFSSSLIFSLWLCGSGTRFSPAEEQRKIVFSCYQTECGPLCSHKIIGKISGTRTTEKQTETTEQFACFSYR